MLTAGRSAEVRGALWDETDTTVRVWTIPAARVKMKREHRVPLSRRALDILGAARTLDGGGSVLVFPSIGGKRLRTTWRFRGLRRSLTSSATRSRRPARGRTCSSGGGDS